MIEYGAGDGSDLWDVGNQWQLSFYYDHHLNQCVRCRRGAPPERGICDDCVAWMRGDDTACPFCAAMGGQFGVYELWSEGHQQHHAPDGGLAHV